MSLNNRNLSRRCNTEKHTAIQHMVFGHTAYFKLPISTGSDTYSHSQLLGAVQEI